MYPLCRIGGAWYGTYWPVVLLGYAAGVLWLRLQLRHLRMEPRIFWIMVATVLAGAVLGGKLGYFLVESRDFLADPAGMLRSWKTGWVFWPGALGGMAAGWAFKAWHNAGHRPRLFLPHADYVMLALPLGHAIGRVGCFLTGCCHGRPSSVPWAVAFTSPAADVADEFLGVPVHPTQLYEAAGELALFLFIAYRILPRVRAARLRMGTGFLAYVLGYSALRFGLEFLRGDDRGHLLSAALSPSQWISLACAAGAIVALRRRGVIERGQAPRSMFADGRD